MPRTLAQHLHAYEPDKAVCSLVCESPSRAQRLAAVIAHWYHLLVSQKNPSIENALRIWSAFRESFEYAFQYCSGDNKLRRASTMVAMMCAHIYGLREGNDFIQVLSRFIRAVRTGEALQTGDPAFALRSYLLNQGTKKGRATRGGGDSQWVIMTKTLRAIQAEFLGERLANLQSVRRPRELIEWFVGDTKELVDKIKLELFTVDGEKHELIPATKAARRSKLYRRYLAQKALEKVETNERPSQPSQSSESPTVVPMRGRKQVSPGATRVSAAKRSVWNF